MELDPHPPQRQPQQQQHQPRQQHAPPAHPSSHARRLTCDEAASRRADTDCAAAQMLREVINGESTELVASRWGVSRSAVERRIKSLARRLAASGAVEGLECSEVLFVQRLRRHRQALLPALERLEPLQAFPSARAARILTGEEVETGARRVRSRSSRPMHDLALYHLLLSTGLRPLEVARLTVADYLAEGGGVRCESVVRSQVSIGGRERPLFFLHRRLQEALDAYLGERMSCGHGLGRGGEWRGLDPGSPLFLDPVGSPYDITANGVAGQRRFVCRSLLDAYRRVFRHAAIADLSAQSARLTLMARMYERGADEEQVGLVLGIADRSAVRQQLPRPRPSLAQVLGDGS